MASAAAASSGEPNAAAAAPVSPQREAAASSSSSQSPIGALFGSLREPTDDGTPGKSVSGEIAALKAEQTRLRDEKKKVAKVLRNAEKRKQRLKTKAKALTDEDLVTVLKMRAEKLAAASSV
jgi:hypothetical protein